MNSKLVRRLAVTLVVPLMAFAAACGGGDDKDKASGTPDLGPVTIVGQDFAEADILVNLYKGLLDHAGFRASVKNLGGRDLYLDPLTKGTDFQISTDYLSSFTEALNRKANGDDAKVVASHDEKDTLDALNKLALNSGVTALNPAEAQDANAFAVTKEFAAANNVKTLSDLGALGKDIKLAAAPDCKKRPDCGVGLTDTYGLKITEYVKTGFGGPDTIDALKTGDVELAQFGTSDPLVDKSGFVLLTDDKGLQNAENLVPIINTKWLEAHQQVVVALDPLADVLTTEDLTTMIGQVSIGREKAPDVATAYLKAKGLLK
ncbi:MAG: putative amino acid transporter amino acid-binding protein [Marmoricola sp.]|nr:putative amino acid transporter amino acid-binding protein [Marmoricola sp.]